MKWIFLGLALAAAATAQIQVSGVRALATGAIVYATGEPAGCTIEVSETADFSALPAAVDETKGGRAACSGGERPANGRSMQIVIGGPGIQTAADGRKYSKALRAFTTYYYRIKQNGTTAVSGSFTTANEHFGNLRMDAPEVDPRVPGDYAYPTIDQSAANWKTTDPATGLSYTKLTKAGEVGTSVYRDVYFAAAAGGWANPANALLDDRAAAVINGSTGPLFLLHDQAGHSLGAGDWADRNSVDYYQVKLKASGSAATAADRTIQLALTADGATAFTPWHDVVLANTEQTYTVGSTTPIDLWQAPGGRTLSRPEIARRTGTVNVAGNIVTYVGGNRFNTLWGAGSQITINGTAYLIHSVDHDMQLTLEDPAGNQSEVPYTADNFGVLIRKKTASADTVSVQFASVTYQTSTAMQWPAGALDMCSPLVITAGDGKQGSNCFINAGLYFAPLDGSGMRYLGDVIVDSGGGENPAPSYACSNFDPRDPDTFWCFVPGGGNTRYLWRRGKYKGDHTRNGNNADGFIPWCASNGGAQPCTEWLNLTPAYSGQDLYTLMRDFGGPPATFPRPPYCSFAGIQKTPANTVAMGMVCWFIQNSMTTFYVFDAGNELPLGTAGSTARLVSYSDTFSRPAQRWGKAHGWNLPTNPDDYGWATLAWHTMDTAPTTTAGYGPYTVTATAVDGLQGGSFTTALRACPANSVHPELQGRVKCTAVTLNRAQPCDDDPDPTFETGMIAKDPALHAAKCGGSGKYYLQDAVEGDYVMFADGSWEIAQILKMDGTNWVLYRGDFYGNFGAHDASEKTFGAQNHTTKTLIMAPNMADYRYAIQGGQHAWKWIGDAHHTSAPSDTAHNLYLINDTAAHGAALRNVKVTMIECSVYGFYNQCFVARVGDIVHRFTSTTWDRKMALNPPPFGQQTFAHPNTVDSHPLPAPATGSGEMFFIDGRPFDGTTITPLGTGVNVGGQLYRFTKADFANDGQTVLKRKYFDTTAFAGANPLKDISSPATGNVIGTDAADAYKYCYAERANECRAGSSAGDVYVNAPQIRVRGCAYEGIAQGSHETRDICIFNNQPHAHRYMQYLLRNDYLGRYSRPLGSGLQLYSRYDPFMNMSASPDGRFAFFRTQFAGWARSDAFSVEVPPIETDSVNRGDFVPVNVSVRPVSGADNAVVEFGYAKFAGTAADANVSPGEFLFCSSRREKCVMGAGAAPYFFEGETYSGVPCSAGCEVKVPAVPGRVLYYRVVQRAGTRAISTGRLSAVVPD